VRAHRKANHDSWCVAALNLAQALPRVVGQEPILGAHLYHARTTNEVSIMCSTENATHMPNGFRKKSVRRKLNTMALDFAGKNLIVDGERIWYIIGSQC
jgi:hypothetical protein